MYICTYMHIYLCIYIYCAPGKCSETVQRGVEAEPYASNIHHRAEKQAHESTVVYSSGDHAIPETLKS